MACLRRLDVDEEGTTATEYALLLLVIALAAAIGMTVLGEGLLALFEDTGTSVVDIHAPGTPAVGTT